MTLLRQLQQIKIRFEDTHLPSFGCISGTLIEDEKENKFDKAKMSVTLDYMQQFRLIRDHLTT